LKHSAWGKVLLFQKFGSEAFCLLWFFDLLQYLPPSPSFLLFGVFGVSFFMNEGRLSFSWVELLGRFKWV